MVGSRKFFKDKSSFFLEDNIFKSKDKTRIDFFLYRKTILLLQKKISGKKVIFRMQDKNINYPRIILYGLFQYHVLMWIENKMLGKVC